MLHNSEEWLHKMNAARRDARHYNSRMAVVATWSFLRECWEYRVVSARVAHRLWRTR